MATIATRSDTQSKVKKALARRKAMQSKKNLWQAHWQLLGEYIHSRKQDFTSNQQEGEMLNKDLFDATAGKANAVMSSSLIGMLWPNGAKSFRLTPPRGVRETFEIKTYYEKISEVLAEAMDDPKAGLATALDEYMKDQGCFGTSGIEIAEDEKLPLVYRAWSVKEMSIDQGKNGFVDTVYIEQQWTVRMLYATYGDRVSEATKEKYNQGLCDDKVSLLIAIEPRLEEAGGPEEGNLAMSFQSLHIELGADHLLRESGFDDLPVKVGRFWKLAKETYGRSPGMEALPDVLEINSMWEAVTLAVEKMLDPPLGVLDDGRLGGGTIDTSAGAINVFNITGRAGERQPVFPLFTVGELQHVGKLIEQLTESIMNHFFMDRLLDLNNEKEMTAYETSIRNRLRGSTLNTLFSRQTAELFSPLIETSFNRMFSKGKLGVIRGSAEEHMLALDGEKDIIYIPDEIAQLMVAGKDVYKIKYVTPAARIMEAEEQQGMIETANFAAELAQSIPDVMDNFDTDIIVRRFNQNSGAPSTGLRDQKTIDGIREQRAASIQAAQEMQLVGEGAKAAKDASAAGLPIGIGGGAVGGKTKTKEKVAA